MIRAHVALARPTRIRTLALGATLGVLVLALALPPLSDGLPRAGQRALLVTLIVIVLWTTEALEPGVTALLGIVLLALTGAADGIRPALQGFANPVPYFLVGVLTMGVAVVISDRERAPALDRARVAGVEALWVNPKDFGDREAYDLALVRELERRPP